MSNPRTTEYDLIMSYGPSEAESRIILDIGKRFSMSIGDSSVVAEYVKDILRLGRAPAGFNGVMLDDGGSLEFAVTDTTLQIDGRDKSEQIVATCVLLKPAALEFADEIRWACDEIQEHRDRWAA